MEVLTRLTTWPNNFFQSWLVKVEFAPEVIIPNNQIISCNVTLVGIMKKPSRTVHKELAKCVSGIKVQAFK